MSSNMPSMIGDNQEDVHKLNEEIKAKSREVESV
jgi:hypothetical protein